MKINEIFYSLQGEGVYMGLPMTFVRVTGCNLRCQWCDTKYAYYDGDELSINEILARLEKHPTKHICITGGEPMTHEETPELINQLINQGLIIYLETNGSIFLGKLPRADTLKISMDIKCPSSGEELKMNFTNLELLDDGDQVKFIIASNDDYEYAKNVLDKFALGKRCPVIFTPCHLIREDKNSIEITLRTLAQRVLKDGLAVHVLPQLHKLIWSDRKRGV